MVANIVERLNRYEMYRGRECRLCDIISLQVRDIGDYISSDSTYRPYVANGNEYEGEEDFCVVAYDISDDKEEIKSLGFLQGMEKNQQ